MADPLSIAASIAGVISLADTVFGAVKKYAKTAKNAEKELEALAMEINLLGGALNSLSRLARALDNESHERNLANLASFRMHHIEGCDNILTEIGKKLKKAEGNILKRKTVWVFSATVVKEMLAELAQHKESIVLALSANSIDMLLRQLAKAGDLQKTQEEVLAEIKKSSEVTMRIHQDSQRETVLEFFLRYNPQPNYEMSLKLRQPRTGMWLLDLPQFRTWLSMPDSKIWLSGIPGAGKTVLAGSIVESALLQSTDDIAAAFFFCDYKDDNTQSPINILAALAHQIAIQKEEAYAVLEEYFKDLHPSTRLAQGLTIRGLQKTLGGMMKLFRQVYIIVDGIDECGKLTEEVLETLCAVSEDSDNASMALLSRDEPHIREQLEDEFIGVKIEAHTADVKEFVTSQIEERIRKGRLRIDDLQLKGEIVQGLIDGAKGM